GGGDPVAHDRGDPALVDVAERHRVLVAGPAAAAVADPGDRGQHELHPVPPDRLGPAALLAEAVLVDVLAAARALRGHRAVRPADRRRAHQQVAAALLAEPVVGGDGRVALRAVRHGYTSVRGRTALARSTSANRSSGVSA